ncbi:N-acetyl-alpha-D-glucosaminyl L-malate synthase BshA, partial [Staphylococcus simulans]
MKHGITCYPSMGGSGIIAPELGITIAERGHDVHFITSNVPYRIRNTLPNITFHQVKVNQYDGIQYPPYVISLNNKMANVLSYFYLNFLIFQYSLPPCICGILNCKMYYR